MGNAGKNEGNREKTEGLRRSDLWVFLSFFMIKCTGLLRDVDLSLSSDHLGDMATPSYLAGKNWLPLISDCSYYGYGFKWLYAVFFKLTDKAEVIFRCIQITQIFMIALCATILYHAVKKYLCGGKDNLPAYLILLLGNGFSSITYNSEGSLYFFSLLIAALLIKLSVTDIKKSKIKYSILLAVLMCYMITLHERTIGLFIAFFIILVCDWIFSRKCYVEPISFTGTLCVLYFLEEKLTDKVVDFFWTVSATDGTLKNTSISVSNPTWLFTDGKSFKLFFDYIVSNILTLVNNSYGMVIIPILLTTYFIIRFFTHRKEFREEYSERRGSIFVMLVFLAMSLIILVGVAQRWGLSAFKGNSNGYKGMAYPRYYMPFIWPALIMGGVLWKDYYEKFHLKVYATVTAIYGIASFYMLFAIRNQIFDNISKTNSSRFGVIVEFFDNLSWGYAWNLALSFLFVTIFWHAYYREFKAILVLAFLAAFFLMYDCYKWAFPKVTTTFSGVRSFLKECEKSVDLGSDLYFLGYDSESESNIYTSQFVLSDYTLHNGWTTGEIIVLSECPPENLADRLREKEYENEINKDLGWLKIDDQWFLYVQGSDNINKLTDSGYYLNKYAY